MEEGEAVYEILKQNLTKIKAVGGMIHRFTITEYNNASTCTHSEYTD